MPTAQDRLSEELDILAEGLAEQKASISKMEVAVQGLRQALLDISGSRQQPGGRMPARQVLRDFAGRVGVEVEGLGDRDDDGNGRSS